MVDIESQIGAIRGAWVKKITTSEGDLSILGQNYINMF